MLGVLASTPSQGCTNFATVSRPRAFNPGLDRDLETICLKCLEKEPARRYGSAEALADDLERWLRGEPIAARPVRAGERLWRWCRRNPAVAALTAAVCLVLTAGAVVSSGLGIAAARAATLAQHRADEANEARQQADDEAQKSIQLAGEEKQARAAARLSEGRAVAEAKQTRREKERGIGSCGWRN